MNETIGSKGGRRDHKRTLLITMENKEKLSKYQKKQQKLKLKQLEKKVKEQQILTFFSAVPIAVTGAVLQELTKNGQKEEIQLLEEKKHKSNKSILTSDQQNITASQKSARNYVVKSWASPKKKVENVKEEALIEPEKNKDILEQLESKKDIIESYQPSTISKEKEEKIEENILKSSQSNKKRGISPKVEVKVTKQEEIPLKETTIDDQLFKNQTLQNLKNKKIIAEYERKLKDVRIELKQLIFEYNVLVDDSNELYESKEAEELLRKLNLIIKKIEELKSKIVVDAENLEEEHYLSYLVEEYITEFKDKKFISDIKDSGLYIMLSEKLEELDTKKDKLNNKVDKRKEKLELDEDKFAELKDRYYDFDNFNNKLLKVQSEQDYLLKEIEEKVSNSVTITEKVEYKAKAMTAQSKKLLKMLAVPMMMPGARSAKALATMTIAYLYFMKKLMKPRMEKKRYKVIEVTDYSKDIEYNLDKIKDTTILLKKTSSKLETMMKDFEKDYKEYFGILPECQKLLDNLKIVLDSIHQKEEELKKIEKEQEKVLETNNNKVKTLTSVKEM